MCTAIQLKLKMNQENVTIFEEHEEIGGTWLVNKYPGCGCDIPSHVYSYSFEQNPHWSKNFVGHEEIHEYLLKIAKKHELHDKIKFCHRVTELKWNESNLEWDVTVLNKKDSKISTTKFNVV